MTVFILTVCTVSLDRDNCIARCYSWVVWLYFRP